MSGTRTGAFGFKISFSKELNRPQRQKLIEKHIPTLKLGKVPELAKEELKSLLGHIKAEGNDLFKEGQRYDLAREHYSAAILLGSSLHEQFGFDLDRENKLMSTLYTNRAFCSIKLKRFQIAIDDCDLAVSLDNTNIKGYFRKTQAQLQLNEKDKAHCTALVGRHIAGKLGKFPDVKKFDELIEQAQDIPSKSNSNTTASSASTKTKNKRQQKATAATVSVSSSGDAQKSANGVDLSWLPSNIQKDTMPKAPKKLTKKEQKKLRQKEQQKQQKAKPNNYQGQFRTLAEEEKSSDSSSASNRSTEEEESEDNGDDTLSWAEQCPPAEPVGYQQQGYQQQKPKFVPQKHAPRFDNYGLDDDFGPPTNARASAAAPAYSTNKPQQKEPANTSNFNVAVAKPQGMRRFDFAVLTPPKPPGPPFDTEYDFSMACDECFAYVGYGPTAYRPNPKLEHKCPRFTLLIRAKGRFDLPWQKIRPRPQNNFAGKFRICTHFMKNEPCGIGEPYCAFAHSDEEMKFWEMDRSNKISIENFIERMRELVFTCQMQKDWGSNKIEPLPKPAIQQATYTAAIPNIPHTQNKQSYVNQPTFGGGAPRGTTRQYVPTSQHNQPPRMTPAPNNSSQFPFPLANTHSFKLVCHECLQHAPLGHCFIAEQPHECSQDILVVQKQGYTDWIHIRERRNHRVFAGKYAMCRNFTAVPQTQCNRAVEMCSFAHSFEEQRIWGLEKDGYFSLQDFIIGNKSAGVEFGIREVMQRYSGGFFFLCHNCFFGQPAIIAWQDRNSPQLCTGQKHMWQENKQLMHIKVTGPSMQVEPIGPRPFKELAQQAFYKMCERQRFCARRRLGQCPFAHSLVERDVWLVERDLGVTPEEIAQESRVLSQQNMQQPPPQQPQQQQQQAAAAAAAPPPVQQAPAMPKCPYRVVCVCKQCHKTGVKNGKSARRDDRCSDPRTNGHIFSINKKYLMLSTTGAVEMSPLPERLPKFADFIVCKHVKTYGKCTYHGVKRCQFAHTDMEREIWIYMFKNKIYDMDKLVELCQEQFAAVTKKNITKGQLVIEATTSAAPQKTQNPAANVIPYDLHLNAFYCQYCSVQCNSNKQWDEHCAGDKHMMNVNSDKDHQWNFRPPPWGVAGNYKLCSSHANNNQCQYSTLPDMYNMCRFAHSPEELDEWKERWEWRQLKREIARSDHVFSYMDALLDEYESEDTPINVLSEDVPTVTISCDKPLTQFNNKKKAQLMWKFTVQSDRPLEKVALLYNRDRLHFALDGAQVEKDSQIAPGSVFQQPDGKYIVQVKFSGGLFGSFMQWLLLDFGGRPVAVRKLNVELGTPAIQDHVQRLRQTLDFDRWTDENRQIVPYRAWEGEESELLKKYRMPTSSHEVVTQESIATELNKHNYHHKMHALLKIEEFTRNKIISSYNLETDAELMACVTDKTQASAGGMIFSRPGELFARVSLGEQLSEDTNAGKLILSSVQSVRLAPRNSRDNTVYEAEIVSKENFDFDGRGRDYVYLCLSRRCVIDMELVDGGVVAVEIQFVMNRYAFCMMHWAVDRLRHTDFVFPDCSKSISPVIQTHQLRSNVMNSDQMKVVQHIASDHMGYTPPLIVYGPFGTGKTETLAQAALLLLEKKPDARILICTNNNHAADLYITKHFDALMKKKASLDILRIYSTNRRVNTVNQQVKRYCLFSPDGSVIVKPTREDVLTKQVVLTTLMSSPLLCDLQVEGYFSHIFLDEGGQALETEAIMPLSLASINTCIVMVGDYMQMGPKIYSQEARRQQFDQSLLQRLFRHNQLYQRHLNLQHSPFNVLLSRNYRSKMEIVRFLSAIFYDGPHNLIAASEQPDVEGLCPLKFYAAQGKEMLDEHATSYYNTSEVEEVVQVVENLWMNWPTDEWGPFQGDLIGVITPYTQQVHHIRQALRKKSRDLGRVNVERVMNAPGKEYRAVIISTVRTSHMIDDPMGAAAASRLDTSECDGEGADFGFMSDQKLLNTALTRAQSLVAVVGDPIALCSIGNCVGLWRAYLKHCSKLKSIEPNTLTLDVVRDQVNHIAHSQRGENLALLNHLADDPSQLQGPARTQQTQVLLVKDTVLEGDKQGVLTDLIKLDMSDDAIERQIIEEARRKNPGQNVKLFRSKSDMMVLSTDIAEAEGEDLAELEISAASEIQMTYSKQQLLSLAQSQPQRFALCTLQRDKTLGLYARPLATESINPHGRIHLGSWQKCAGAFIHDEVVVEVSEDKVTIGEHCLNVGKVLDVTRRNRGIPIIAVCRPSSGNHNLMMPLNENLSPVHLLASKQYVDKLKHGNVLVYHLQNGRVVPSHYEPVDNSDSKLLVVRYLKYDAKYSCSLGVVVGVLPPGTDLASTKRILDVEYLMPGEITPETSLEAREHFPDFYRFSVGHQDRRLLYHDKLAFTIEDPDNPVWQKAFSVELHKDGKYLIGVHVPDVSYFVAPRSKIYNEARHRSSSLSNPEIDMLPKRLSEDLCSFKPGEQRLALSIFFTIDSNAVIDQVRPLRSIICSKRNVTYSEAENMLTSPMPTPPPEQTIAMQILWGVARSWRQTRLGNAATTPSKESSTPRTQLIIEEIILTANHTVAQLFMRQKVGALCQQLRPNKSELLQWKRDNPAVQMLCPSLLWPHTSPISSCSCQDQMCQCAPPDEQVLTINLSVNTWEYLRQLADLRDSPKVQDVVLTPNGHPGLAIAKAALEEVTPKENYIPVTEELKPEVAYHCNNHVEEYTHFTSPLTCFFDLVVHRVLVAMLLEEEDPYTATEMNGLCEQLGQQHSRMQQHKEAIDAITELSLTPPSVTFAIVKETYRDGMELLITTSDNIPLQTVNLSSLGNWTAENRELRIRLSLYDNQSPAMVACSEVNVSPSAAYMLQLHRQEWMMLVEQVRSFEPQHLCELVQYFDTQSGTLESKRKVVEAADERAKIPLQQSTSLQMKSDCVVVATIEVKNIIRVQVGCGLLNGILQPQVELLYLTPELAVCTCHNTDPVKCFAPNLSTVNRQAAAKTNYRDLDSYKDSWQPVVTLEAMEEALETAKTEPMKVVQNIPIQLHSSGDASNKDAMMAVLLMHRSVYNKLSDSASAFETAYVCIRYDDNETVYGSGPSWIAHGKTTAVTDSLSPQVKLHVSIQRQNRTPHQGLVSGGKLVSVQFMLVDWKHRGIEYCLESFEEASQQCISLVLGRELREIEPSVLKYIQEVVVSLPVPGLPVFHPTQDQAVEKALTQPLTVIKGGPGTGKTVALVKIMCLMVRLNERVDHQLRRTQEQGNIFGMEKRKVLVVAPTELCLERIIGVMKLLAEASPATQMPRCAVLYNNKSDLAMGELPAFVTAVYTPGGHKLPIVVPPPTPVELLATDVLLTTPDTLSRLAPPQGGALWSQVLVDSAEGVSEMELLMALRWCKDPIMNQVVLAGDVHQATQKSHRSMLERYQDQGITLSTQFRMHIAIADFPSEHWYRNSLMYGTEEQRKPSTIRVWTGGRDRPIMFVDVGCEEGQEIGCTLNTLTNPSEAAEAARVASLLVLRCFVHADTVAVLSLYPAQAKLIQETLQQRKQPDITVLPVSQARGCEWDYVVVSTVRVQPKSTVELHPSKEWQDERLGLAADPGLLNIAMSRARKGVIVIGCQQLLKVDRHWHKLLQHYAQHGKMASVSEVFR